MRLSRQRMLVGTRAATSEWLTTMGRRVDENRQFSFYKFTACTSTLKSINLPHSSRLISKANHFMFELRFSILVLCCVLHFCICIASLLRYTSVYYIACRLSRFLLVALKPTLSLSQPVLGYYLKLVLR